MQVIVTSADTIIRKARQAQATGRDQASALAEPALTEGLQGGDYATAVDAAAVMQADLTPVLYWRPIQSSRYRGRLCLRKQAVYSQWRRAMKVRPERAKFALLPALH